jgi:D-serine deaminase-like pyridoxal phosphate-dependent protein
MQKISKPTLLLDKDKCIANIRKMSSKAHEAGVRFRPHFKTHASLEVGRWIREEGNVDYITVSSLTMAKYFAVGGNDTNHNSSSLTWKDITVAFPVNILEIETINELIALSSQSSKFRLNLLVENLETTEYLQQHIQGTVGIYVKIDVGYGRTGIPADDFDRVESLLLSVKQQSNLEFCGFLSHAGQSYGCRSREDLLMVHNTTRELLGVLRERFQPYFPQKRIELSIGDTPTCSIIEPSDLDGIDEIRPGNFVFYDVEQAEIGSCSYDEIAVAVACPIVARHPSRRELILYGGGVHLSKDRLTSRAPNSEGITTSTVIYGRVVRSLPNHPLKWGSVIEGMYLRSTSQEHGIVVVPLTEDFDAYHVGDILKVLPVHSCMTADVMSNKGYLTCEGEWITRMKD